MIAETILLNAATGLAVGGAWVVKALWSSQNGNGNLTKEHHRDLCESVKRRLDEGDLHFAELLKKIDSNYREVIEILLDLTAKVAHDKWRNHVQ